MKEAEWHLPHGHSSNRPKIIVIHAMGEYIDTEEGIDYNARDWLDKLGYSAHILGTPSGVQIRCRRDEETAFHAKGHNMGTLGYEFLVPGLHTYATFLEAMKNDYLLPQQYREGVKKVREWVHMHSITRDNVVRHSDIDPSRKKDPGAGFPWLNFLADVFEEVSV